ncbi:hypothetical protein K0B03_01495 [Patescibacteria group bacterium]|nr:hypothetical protein [Patescibacteria group bacterium]
MSNKTVRTMAEDIESLKKEALSSQEAKSDTATPVPTPLAPSEPTKKDEIQKINTAPISDNSPSKTTTPVPTVKFSGAVNDAQSNELKTLINRISRQTEKDIDNASDISIKKSETETNTSPSLQNDSAQQSKKDNNTIKPDLNSTPRNYSPTNNAAKKEDKKEQIEKETLDDIINEEKSTDADAKNKDIEDLKKLLERISNTSSDNTTKEAHNESSSLNSEKIKSQELDQKIQNDLKSDFTANETKSITTDKTKPIANNIKESLPSEIKNEIEPITTSTPEKKTTTPNDKKALFQTNLTTGVEQTATNLKSAVMPTTLSSSTEKFNKTETVMSKVKDDDKLLEEKKEKTSFWKKFSKAKKETISAEKINQLTPAAQLQNEKKNDINEKPTNAAIVGSGVIESAQTKQEESEKKKQLISNYYKADYISPVDRLAQGKQELYSSLSKKVNLKSEKGELDALKQTEEGKKKERVITKDQEYRELKKSIKQKYHIRLSLLPWKRIIVLSIFFLIIVGVGYWKLFSAITPSPPPPPQIVITGEEINEFSNMEDELVFKKNDFNVTQLELDAKTIFAQNKNIEIIKLKFIDNDTDQQVLTFEKALEMIRVKNDEVTLPSDFLNLTTNSYNIFIFKTTKVPVSIRYGIAVKAKSENSDKFQLMMKSWEENRIPNQKMIRILKPLFVNDAGFEEADTFFSSVNYSKENIELRYVGIEGSEKAIDYFIHKDILVITTSKDSALLMADLLIN